IAYIVAVLAASAGVGAVIVQKILTKRDSEPVLMTYYMIAITVVSGVPAFLAWHPVEPAHWPVILVIGLTALAGQFCFLRAYRLGEASFLAPFGYFRMILAIAAGWLLFSEWPDNWTLAGAAIIIVAAALLGARWRRVPSG
ncbi:MAG: EamA family transporter, partial [Pseudomonadota bacterium]